jgi:hypothetical protein
VLNHVRRALKQADHLIEPAERRAIDQALEALRAVESGTDRDAIRERTIELNKVTERLAEAMMDAALKGAVGSRRADEILADEIRKDQ